MQSYEVFIYKTIICIIVYHVSQHHSSILMVHRRFTRRLGKFSFCSLGKRQHNKKARGVRQDHARASLGVSLLRSLCKLDVIKCLQRSTVSHRRRILVLSVRHEIILYPSVGPICLYDRAPYTLSTKSCCCTVMVVFFGLFFAILLCVS